MGTRSSPLSLHAAYGLTTPAIMFSPLTFRVLYYFNDSSIFHEKTTCCFKYHQRTLAGILCVGVCVCFGNAGNRRNELLTGRSSEEGGWWPSRQHIWHTQSLPPSLIDEEKGNYVYNPQFNTICPT